MDPEAAWKELVELVYYDDLNSNDRLCDLARGLLGWLKMVGFGPVITDHPKLDHLIAVSVCEHILRENTSSNSD